MPLTWALFSQINYYHVSKSSNTPFDTLIWACILAGIFLITTTAAHLARAREHRKLAEENETSAPGQTPR